MALLAMEGLDIYADWDDFASTGWFRDNTGTTLQTTAGRFGGGAIRWHSTIYGITTSIPIIPYGNALILCFAYQVNSASSATWLRCLTDTGLVIATAGHDTSFQTEVTPQTGGTTSSGTTDLTSGTWHWIEIKVLFGTTAANGTMEIKVDGVSKVSITGADTNYTGIGCSYIELNAGGHAVNYAYTDDIIIMDDTGSTMNNYIGDSIIETLSPNADAATVDWTANGAASDYQCVDDTPSASNGDTDYISSSTAAQESRFAFTNLSSSPTTIHSVSLRIRARKDNPGPRTMRGLLNSNATESTGDTFGPGDNYIWSRPNSFWDVDPDTASAWTEGGVNALEAGVEIVA